jgi:hypothetical protein
MRASLRTLSWTSSYIRDDCRALNPFRNGDLCASIEGSLHSKDRRRHGKGRKPSDGHRIRGPNYSIISTLGESITAVMRRTAAGRGGIIDHAKRTHRCLNCDDNGRGGDWFQGNASVS